MNSCSSKYSYADQFLLFVLAKLFFYFKFVIIVDACMIYPSIFLDEFSMDIEVLLDV